MPETFKGKHTQFCEELDQWRSRECVTCLSLGGSPTGEHFCGHGQHDEFKIDKPFNVLYCSKQCDIVCNTNTNLKKFFCCTRYDASNHYGTLAALQVNTNNGSSGPNPGADFEKSGIELDLREGGVRYRVKLRKYVVEYRPSRFKWKLWMGTYSSLQDGRRAYDCAVFYAGQGKGNYYFRNSPELFKNLGPLERPFHMVSKDIRDKPFNIEVKKRAKEVIKRSVRLGDMEAPSILASKSARIVAEVEGFEKELESKEMDPTFKDLEPLFHLHPPLYNSAEQMIGSNGLSRSEMIDSSFFVAGLNSMDMPRFVLDCKSDESCHSDLPLWMYEFMNPPSWIDESQR